MKNEVGSEEARKALLDECENIIIKNKTRAAEEARAWALIECNELWKEAGEKDFADYKKKRGFSPSYVSRVLRFGRLLLAAKVPEGLEPAETAVRPLLKACYDGKTQVDLYRAACKRRKEMEGEKDARNEKKSAKPELSGARGEEQGGEDIASSNDLGDAAANATDTDGGVPESLASGEVDETVAMVPEPEEAIDVVPFAADIRMALKDFRDSSTAEIFLTSIEVKVNVDADFVKDVLEVYSDRIRNVRLLCEVVKQFKNKAKTFDATTAKKVQEFAHAKQQNELNELLAAISGEPGSNSKEESEE